MLPSCVVFGIVYLLIYTSWPRGGKEGHRLSIQSFSF
jgi:hypothetical protein